MTARPSSFQRLARLSGSNKLVLIEAAVALSAASAAIKLFPFHRTARIMRFQGRRTPRQPAAERRQIAQCRWAVGASADRVPWKAVCFQRGLALHLMLRRRGITSLLHYGVAQSRDQGLRAHVWISVNGQVVLGGAEAAEFTCVASFPSSTQG